MSDEQDYNELLITDHIDAEAKFLETVANLIYYLERYKEEEVLNYDGDGVYSMEDVGEMIDDIIDVIKEKLLVKIT